MLEAELAFWFSNDCNNLRRFRNTVLLVLMLLKAPHSLCTHKHAACTNFEMFEALLSELDSRAHCYDQGMISVLSFADFGFRDRSIHTAYFS